MTPPQSVSGVGEALPATLAKEAKTESVVTDLSAEQLLAALDAQIRFVADSQNSEGWTRWAIWGALGGLTWVGTDLISKDELAISWTVLLACGVFVLWKLLEQFARIISPSSRLDIGLTRFRFVADAIGNLRPEVSASAAQYLLILAALAHFQFPGQGLLWAYSIFAFVFFITIVAYGMTGIALPTYVNMGVLIWMISAIQIAWLAAIALQIGALILSSPHIYTLAEVRLALVLNAGSWLLIRLATATSSEHLLNQLTQLRQHIAFQRLALPDARRQVESLLTGLALVDILSPAEMAIKKEAAELRPVVAEFLQLASQVSEKLTTAKGQLHNEVETSPEFASALKLLDGLEIHADRLKRKLKGVVRATNRFNFLVITISMYSAESRHDIRAAVAQIRIVYGEANKSVAEALQQQSTLKAEANELASGASPNPRPVAD